MKKVTVLFITFLFSFIIMGCGVNTVGDWVFSLQDVERRADVQQVYGESKIISFDDEGITNYSYEDDIVKISMLPFGNKISFSLQNKSQDSIKIIWDESVYIENGITDGVIHSFETRKDIKNIQDAPQTNNGELINKVNDYIKNIQYIPQTPTIVAKDTTINDNIVPSKNILYGYSVKRGMRVGPHHPAPGWSPNVSSINSTPTKHIVEVRPLLFGWTNYIVTQEELDDYIQKNTDKIIKVSLALQIDGIINYYIFSFLAKDFRQKKINTFNRTIVIYKFPAIVSPPIIRLF